MLSASTVVPHVSTGMRYLGARLAAGFADAALVAEILAVSIPEYRGYESHMVPMPDVADQLSRLFGVSREYIVYGRVANERERLADLIAHGLARFEVASWGARRTAAARHFPAALTAMRLRAGYGSAAKAAAAYGWNPEVHLAHESGSLPIGIDHLCFYALALGMRPDNALLGEKPARLASHLKMYWWEAQHRGDHVDSKALVSPAFDWLMSANCAAAVLTLPLVEFTDDGWTLQEDLLEIPRTIIPSNAATVGDTLYGMVNRRSHSVQIVVTDPTRLGRSRVEASGLGALRVLTNSPAQGIVDPTRRSRRKRSDYFPVGAYVVTVGTRKET